MDLRPRLQKSLAILRGIQGCHVRICNVGNAVGLDEISIVEVFMGKVQNDQFLNLYKNFNGLEIDWTIDGKDGPDVHGSIHLPGLRQAFLGSSIKSDGESNEGILWNDEFSSKTVARLKKMRILESIIGVPEFVTFEPGKPTLYFVEEETIVSLEISLSDYLGELIDCLGQDGIRECLFSSNWREDTKRFVETKSWRNKLQA